MRIALFTLFALFIIFSPVCSQDKKSIETVKVPIEEPDKDILSPFEIQQKNKLTLPFGKAMDAVNQLLEAGKKIENDAQATAYGYRAASVAWQYFKAQQDLNDWLMSVRKAHNCLDCELDSKGDRLVRPQKKDTVSVK